MKVLIVDDEHIIRRGIRTIIPWDTLGVEEVFMAASGEEALEIFIKELPALVISDINMAKMSGLEMIEQIRKLQEDTRVIILTGYDDFDYARTGLRLQVQDFLLKPVDEQILLKAVKREIQSIRDVAQEKEQVTNNRRIDGSRDQVKLEQYMRNLIYQQETVATLSELKEHYNFTLENSLRVAVLIPEIAPQAGKEKEYEPLMQLNIKSLLMGYVDTNNYGITFVDDKGLLVVLFFIGNKSDEIANHLETLINLVKIEYGVLLRAVLGSKVEGFHHANISYNDAIYMLSEAKDAFHLQMTLDGSGGQLQLFREVYVEFLHHITSEIGNTEYVLRVFEAFVTASNTYNITDQYVRKCCFEIASSVYFSYIVESGTNSESKINSLLLSLLSANREGMYRITQAFLLELLRKDDEDDEFISNVKKYILSNLTQELSVSAIAAYFYLSPNYFSRLFKRVTKERCNEYITRKRMEQAEYLLSSTNMNINLVALEIGYRDSNYFSMAFKKHASISPLQYRKNARGSKE